MSRPARIGLLGGTFDPIHVGHLWLGQTAVSQLALDAVWFMPVGQPVHKDSNQITAVSHRLRMVELAIDNNPAFALHQFDMKRPPPHSTVSLLDQLQIAYPDTNFWLLLGGDSLRDLSTWVEPARLITLCRLAVLPRPDVDIAWERVKTAVPGVDSRVDWLSGPTVYLSSSQIRAWRTNGRSLRYLVPDTVLEYIEQQALYR